MDAMDFIVLEPWNITDGDKIVRAGHAPKILWGDPYPRDFAAVVPVNPAYERFDEEMYWAQKLRPAAKFSRYEDNVINGESLPWVKPNVTFEFRRARYGSATQPVSQQAKREDGLPVSPGRLPLLHEMSAAELEAFADVTADPWIIAQAPRPAASSAGSRRLQRDSSAGRNRSPGVTRSCTSPGPRSRRFRSA